MAKTVTLTLTTVDTPLPDATTFSGFKYSLTSSTNEVVNNVTTETVVNFANTSAGTYTATVVAIDQNGNPFGNPVSLTVTVPPDAVPTFPAPASLSATVA